ncbi:MAG: Brp/Blh family beta-carotene 15,15'-dioxygenase [Paracoccaceae bacterium]
MSDAPAATPVESPKPGVVGDSDDHAARHRTLVLLAVPALLAGALAGAPSLETQLFLLAPLVAILGVPHGALDWHIAARVWALRSPSAHLGFAALYLGLAGATLVLWLAAPTVGLASFLAYSAVHFADDWRGELPFAQRLAVGAGIVVLPTSAHAGEVAAIFGTLADPEGGAAIAAALDWIGLPLSVALIGIASAAARLAPRLALEIALLALAAWVAPPLVFFVVYFCFVHSPRHFLNTTRALGLELASGIKAAAPLTAVGLLGASAAAGAIWFSGLPQDVVILRTVFIGLAVLTVPHMLLVDHFRSRQNK